MYNQSKSYFLYIAEIIYKNIVKINSIRYFGLILYQYYFSSFVEIILN